jgi:hypothetical protein
MQQNVLNYIFCRVRIISLLVTLGVLTIKTLGSIPTPNHLNSLISSVILTVLLLKAEVYLFEGKALGIARRK